MNKRTQQLDTPIFIGGASSSGNTLLAKMFSRHPHVFCGHEMSLFNKRRIYADFETVKRKLPSWTRRGLPTDGYSQYFKIIPPLENRLFTKEALLRCVSEATSLRDLVDRIQIHCLSATGKSIFAEKTPSDVYCYRQLAELYPRCLLIHVIRDGRDVACSLMKRGFDIFEAASIWLYNAACGIGCRDLPNYVEIHYENLVKDPQPILQAICERVSIPFDPCMLSPQKGEQASRFAQAGYWKSCVSDQVNQQSVGRHQTGYEQRSICCLLQRAAYQDRGAESWHQSVDRLRTPACAEILGRAARKASTVGQDQTSGKARSLSAEHGFASQGILGPSGVDASIFATGKRDENQRNKRQCQLGPSWSSDAGPKRLKRATDLLRSNTR